MKNKRFFLLLISFLVIFSFNCADSIGNQVGKDSIAVTPVDMPGEDLKSNIDRDTSPAIDQAEVTIQVAGNNDFAFNLYRQIVSQNSGNIFFSPYSISSSLAMILAGTSGETETGMENTLNFYYTQDKLHPIFNYLDLQLSAENLNYRNQFIFNNINTIWIQTGNTISSSFLDTLALNYGTGLRMLDFQSSLISATYNINEWIGFKTDWRIYNLIPDGALSSEVKLLLTNATYLNAIWAYSFDSYGYQSFTTSAGQTVQVPMMIQKSDVNYFSDSNYTAVELPYEGKKFSMLIILPANMSSFEPLLNSQLLAEIKNNMTVTTMLFAIPYWYYQGSFIALKYHLSNMGMSLVFSENTGFSGMNEESSLYLTSILHQANINVNESGIDDAVFTPTNPGATATVPFIFNKSFTYLIRDIPTGQILFMGKVTDPR